MILTFVVVNRNAVTVAVKNKENVCWYEQRTWLCRGVSVEKEASVQRIQRRHTMWRNGGTVYVTFVFVNQENEQTVKIEKV